MSDSQAGPSKVQTFLRTHNNKSVKRQCRSIAKHEVRKIKKSRKPDTKRHSRSKHQKLQLKALKIKDRLVKRGTWSAPAKEADDLDVAAKKAEKKAFWKKKAERKKEMKKKAQEKKEKQ